MMKNKWVKYSVAVLLSVIVAGLGGFAGNAVAAESSGVVADAVQELSQVHGELSKVQGNVIYVKGAAYQVNRETVVLSPTGARTILPAGSLPRQVVMKYYLPDTVDESVNPVAVEIQLLPVQPQ